MTNAIYTPKTLFADYDRSGDFDLTVIKEEQTEGVTVRYFYFNGNKKAKGVTRVYGICAYIKRPAPCVIRVGEIGITHDIQSLIYFAKLGFFAVAADYAGDGGRGAHTVYPDDVFYANLSRAGRRINYADLTARDTTWFEWDINTLRLIDLIFEKGYAKDNKVALYSVGQYASRVAVHVLATDKRVQSGAVAFGNIWDETIRKMQSLEQLSVRDLNKSMQELDEEERWLSAIAPQGYLQYITQPLYLITGANSSYTSIIENRAAMKRCKNIKSRHLYIKDALDSGNDEILRNVARWFNICFEEVKNIPPEPHLSFRSKQGNLYCAVKREECVDAQLFYTRGNIENKIFNWIQCESIKEDNWVKGQVCFYNKEMPVTAYATVKLNGLLLSGDPQTVYPQDYQAEECPRSRILYQQEEKLGSFLPLKVEGNSVRSHSVPLLWAQGPFGIKGIKGKNLGTFAVAEYPFSAGDSFLSFDIFCENKGEADCFLLLNWGEEEAQEIYVKHISFSGGCVWQKIKAEFKDFKCLAKNGKALDAAKKDKIHMLSFSSQENIIINNVIFG